MQFFADLYIKPLTFFFWISRSVYIGIVAGVLYFHDKFVGEFNIWYTVDPRLVPVTIAGLAFFELGAWIGWRIPYRPSKGRWLRSANFTEPFVIWLFALFLSIVLFASQGAPLLTNIMDRTQIGVGLGVLKRAMVVFLPMACLEIYCLYLQTRRHMLLSNLLLFFTLSILLLYSAKSGLFFLIIYVFLAYYLLRLRYQPKWWRKLINTRTIFIAFVLLSVIYLYNQLALKPIGQNFGESMTARTTTLFVHAANYIISDSPGTPTRGELLYNELANIMRTFRIPGSWTVRQLDSEITTAVLQRPVEAGGLNPTVIGYGWLLAGGFGVGLLSLWYGYLTARYVKRLTRSPSAMAISVFIYALFTIFGAVQIFSPVIIFLDTGLSILMYIVLHRLLHLLFISLTQSSKRTMQSGILACQPN